MIPKPRSWIIPQGEAKLPTYLTTNGQDRTADPVQEQKLPPEDYRYIEASRGPSGGCRIENLTPGKYSCDESDPMGNFKIVDSGGSIFTGTVGTKNDWLTNGKTQTNQGLDDSKCFGHQKSEGGHDRTNISAGESRVINGDVATYTTGSTTIGSAGDTSSFNKGKSTISAEGGIGMGVNKGSERKVYQRMEADGTYHLQVTPAGDTGGMATIKINPNGSVFVTSESTLDINVKGTMSIKAPLLTIDAPIETTSTIKSDGSHTASFYYGGGHSWPE